MLMDDGSKYARIFKKCKTLSCARRISTGHTLQRSGYLSRIVVVLFLKLCSGNLGIDSLIGRGYQQ